MTRGNKQRVDGHDRKESRSGTAVVEMPSPDAGNRATAAAPAKDSVTRQLKALYDAAVEQPVPKRFLDLLGVGDEVGMSGHGSKPN